MTAKKEVINTPLEYVKVVFKLGRKEVFDNIKQLVYEMNENGTGMLTLTWDSKSYDDKVKIPLANVNYWRYAVAKVPDGVAVPLKDGEIKEGDKVLFVPTKE